MEKINEKRLSVLKVALECLLVLQGVLPGKPINPVIRNF
jgi:hypothetical protein